MLRGYLAVTISVIFCFNTVREENALHSSDLAVYSNVILATILLFLILLLARQPQSTKELSFKVCIYFYIVTQSELYILYLELMFFLVSTRKATLKKCF